MSILDRQKKQPRGFKLRDVTIERLDGLAAQLEKKLKLPRRPSRTAVLEAAVALCSEIASDKADGLEFLRRLAEAE